MKLNPGVEHFVRWRINILDEAGTQHVELGNSTRAKSYRLLLRDGFQGMVEVVGKNTAGAYIVAKNFTGKITLAAKPLQSPRRSLMERMDFQSMEWVVMNKRPHGPIIGDDLAREPNQGSELHTLGFGVRPLGYLSHVVISMVVRWPWANASRSNNP